MRLLLIRHGETQQNADGVTLGRADVPLNERGRQQANALVALADGHHSVAGASPPAAVYASPLQRAVATAGPLAQAAGIDVQTDPRLIEMEIGELEGMPFAHVRDRYPEFLRMWLSDDLADARMPGGETLREVQQRAWEAIAELVERHAHETVAVVAHNFVILSLLCRSMNLPLAKFRSLRQDLAAVSAIDMGAESIRVVTLNDRCHLTSD